MNLLKWPIQEKKPQQVVEESIYLCFTFLYLHTSRVISTNYTMVLIISNAIATHLTYYDWMDRWKVDDILIKAPKHVTNVAEI